ncbi:hypothetical protein Ga0100231_005015 [Opitutaceae bacterium TAV4]|nr:hypothetical protein Ga0100231_005015 [Opitutaceae bacterium TAV4]RRK02356.1 hypothetical protein Ga0100230_004160 [Opitutaceae bacterium TAV3]
MAEADYFTTSDVPDIDRNTLANISKFREKVSSLSLSNLERLARGLHYHKKNHREIVNDEITIKAQRKASRLMIATIVVAVIGVLVTVAFGLLALMQKQPHD